MEAQTAKRMTHDEAVARAKALAAKLRGRMKEGELLYRQPDETIQDIMDSGLATILKPARFGGHELTLDALVDTTIEVAKANPAAGWCYTFVVAHQWMLATWPQQAQQEVWSENPNVNIATALAFPRNEKIVRVEGGYQLSGEWSFSSGIEHSEWVMASSTERSFAGEDPQRYMFLVPRSDYTIVNEWQVAGLKASGSNGFTISDAFVPEHRVINLSQWAGPGVTPGMSINRGASYNVPLYCALPTCLTSAIVGASLGAYEFFIKTLRERLSKNSNNESGVPSHFKQRVTELSAQIDAAETLLRKALDVIRPGGEFDLGQRARLHRNYSYLARSCSSAVDELFQFSGSAAVYDWNVMQVYWRDVKVMSMHGYLNFDAASDVFGSYELGSSQ
ncbi:hypothetical protein EDM59_13050 [Brevibacillus nitrificans]|uniref:Acyl-CoA dehydrogenase C-terminal domain-containing protein n=1 Tax=Brevibacillus nitrificans TaxID=651560 RepID=A0A3M8DBB5_9BACL|nr:hypothetical protein [Brevibacillus nitrificans]RNB85324.1 hypothetical protein EDM59_13050 [Brevibacillus nitrificans]